jgi:hypothetical protein
MVYFLGGRSEPLIYSTPSKKSAVFNFGAFIAILGARCVRGQDWVSQKRHYSSVLPI